MEQLSHKLADLAAQLLPDERVRDRNRIGALGEDDAPLRARLVESWQGQVLTSARRASTLLRSSRALL